MDWLIFFKALGVTTLFVALLSGFGYWILSALQKKYPNMKYVIKYKVFRRKYNPDDVAMLIEDAEQGVNDGELLNALILSNKVDPARAKELLYVYNEIKMKMKGGIKNE